MEKVRQGRQLFPAVRHLKATPQLQHCAKQGKFAAFAEKLGGCSRFVLVHQKSNNLRQGRRICG